jgi:hypothetical protein
VTGSSFFRNRTLPDIAPCGAARSRRTCRVPRAGEMRRFAPEFIRPKPTRVWREVTGTIGRKMGAAANQSERGRYRSATGPTPLGCAKRYRSATEPLRNRYRSRARPEHASRARPDQFCQQSCRQIGYGSQLSTAWNCAETPRTPRNSATQPLPIRYRWTDNSAYRPTPPFSWLLEPSWLEIEGIQNTRTRAHWTEYLHKGLDLFAASSDSCHAATIHHRRRA